MLGSKMMMFIMVLFILGTLVSMTVEGEWFAEDDKDLMNDLTGYNMVEMENAGVWSIAKLGFGFLTHGVPKVLMWNYSFFDGPLMLFRIMLIVTLSTGIIWAIAQVFIGILQGIFGGLGRVLGG